MSARARKRVLCPHPDCQAAGRSYRADGIKGHYGSCHPGEQCPDPKRLRQAPVQGQGTLTTLVVKSTPAIAPGVNGFREGPSAGVTNIEPPQQPTVDLLPVAAARAAPVAALATPGAASRSEDPRELEEVLREVAQRVSSSDDSLKGIRQAVQVLQVATEKLVAMSERKLREGDSEALARSQLRHTTVEQLMEACGFEKIEHEGEEFAKCPKCTRYKEKEVRLKIGNRIHKVKKNWQDHLRSQAHKDACALEGELAKVEERRKKIGMNLARLVVQMVREAGSYQSFEKKVVDFEQMGGYVGRFNHSCKFAAKMVGAMYEVTIELLIEFIHSADPDTGRPRVFAATADKVTELHRTGQAIGLLFWEDGEVKAFFADYLLARDGTGKGLAHDLVVRCLMQKLKFTREALLQQFVGFAADGQYFAVGVVEDMARALLPEAIRNNTEEVEKMMHWLLCTWDAAHRLELTLADTRKDKDGVGEALAQVDWYSNF